MHELSIAMSLIEIATAEVERRGAQRVKAIHIKVGPMAGVVDHALRSAYELAREQSPLAEAELVIEPAPLTAFCDNCQQPQAVASIQDMRCQACGRPTAEVVTGRELEVTAMEIVP